MRDKNFEVLFCYQTYDEMVMLQLRQFDRKSLTSVEKEMRQMKDDVNLDSLRKLLYEQIIAFCTEGNGVIFYKSVVFTLQHPEQLINLRRKACYPG